MLHPSFLRCKMVWLISMVMVTPFKPPKHFPWVLSITLHTTPLCRCHAYSHLTKSRPRDQRHHWPDSKDHSLHLPYSKWNVFSWLKQYTGILVLHMSLSQALLMNQSLQIQLWGYQISNASELHMGSQTMVSVKLLCDWRGSQSLEATL